MRNQPTVPVRPSGHVLRSALTLVAAIAVLTACGVDEITSPCADAAADAARRGDIDLIVWPEEGWFGHQVAIGDTLRLEAWVAPVTGGDVNVSFGNCEYHHGDPIPTTITWASSDSTIARVDATGRVIGRAAGTVTIEVRAPVRGLAQQVDVEVIR